MTLGHRVCVCATAGCSRSTRRSAVRAAGQPLRGRLHRLAGDELRHGRADPGRRARGRLRRLQARGARRGHREQAGPRQVLRAARSSSVSGRPTSRTPRWPTRAGPRMRVTAGVTEELGSEIHVIFTIDAPPVRARQHHRRGHRGQRGRRERRGAGRRQVAVDRAGRGPSPVRPSQPVELAIDTANLQFFDAGSGLSIGHPAAHPAATAAGSCVSPGGRPSVPGQMANMILACGPWL